MSRYKIYTVELSNIEKELCDELNGETFYAKNGIEADEIAKKLLKKKLKTFSSNMFDIDCDIEIRNKHLRL
jgi:hypothetical protein